MLLEAYRFSQYVAFVHMVLYNVHVCIKKFH